MVLRRDSLDQVYPVVDGRPVQKCDVLFVRLTHIVARLNQLSASLEDPVPERARERSEVNLICHTSFTNKQTHTHIHKPNTQMSMEV